MTPFDLVHREVTRLIDKMAAAGDLPPSAREKLFTVEPPREAAHGDMSTNVAMVLAKEAGVSPRVLAAKFETALKACDNIRDVQIAGPGFINITFHDDLWRRHLAYILIEGGSYGRSRIGAGRKVNVEFVSANPTGPMHVGHCRGAVFGDALARLLERTGYEVCREYYINDAGAQVDILARSVFLRYCEALGQTIDAIPEGLYPGDYLVPVGEALKAQFGSSLRHQPESDWLPILRDFSVAAMMDIIRADLDALNIHFDVFFSERGLTAEREDKIAQAIDRLGEKGLIYTGILEPPKGKLPDDWEERPQTLFRATAFGDDVDRPLLKSDGNYTYFASDIAYHFDKAMRGFDVLIDVWGADHGGYVKRVQAAVAALAGEAVELDVKLCQLVRLFRGGEPVRMSKRAGSFITLRDVVDEVGRDVVRFMMLTRKNEAPLDFDFVKVMDQSRDNPVFYVQYAHARVHSVFRNARELMPRADLSAAGLAGISLQALADESELAVIRHMAAFPRMLEAAALAHEPHRVAFFLSELAGLFHGLWNKGKEEPALRFIIEDDENVTLARLALIRAVAQIIAAGLDILGVVPVEEMR
jgi:arginyl-tRNA synthetase